MKIYYKQDLIRLKGIGVLVVLSGSMEPTISQREMIIIQKQDEYRINDIVTYKDNLGRLITHRIVEINGDKIITQGDYNNTKDSSIKKSAILGKVIFHSVCLGAIWLYILKPFIIILCISYILSFLKYLIFAKIVLKICKYC